MKLLGQPLGGAPAMNRPKLTPHPPGQNRLGGHPNTNNAATGIRTNTPAPVRPMNRVGRKEY